MKDKICHFTISHNPFDERIFYKECSSLSKQYEVNLVTTCDKNHEKDNINIIGIGRNKNNFHRLIRTISIIPILLKTKSKVYHFHDPELLITGFILKFIFRKRVVYDIHEDYTASLKTHGINKNIVSLWNKIELSLSSLFDLNIVVDSHLMSKFKNSSTILIGNYPFASFAKDVVKIKKEKDVFKLVYLGSITEDRGLRTAVEVVEKIKDFDIELHIIGESKFDDLTKLFNNSNKVFYHGRIPWTELKENLLEYDAGLILLKPVPAYTYSTGENIVKLFEYAAIGIPSIISDFPGLNKFIKENGGGLLVNPIDVNDIIEKVTLIYNNKELREKLSNESKKFVLKKYNWDMQQDKLIKAYSKIV